jgi:hypothetical protein
MGLFDRFILPEYRLAATKIKDYATSLQSTNTEQQLAALLGVELHQFIGERNLLRIGFTRSALGFYVSQSAKPEVSLANHFNEKMLEEYFSSRPGMAASDGLAILAQACRTYYLEEPEQVAEKFLANLVAVLPGRDRQAQSAHVQQYVQSLLREALTLVRDQLSKV